MTKLITKLCFVKATHSEYEFILSCDDNNDAGFIEQLKPLMEQLQLTYTIESSNVQLLIHPSQLQAFVMGLINQQLLAIDHAAILTELITFLIAQKSSDHVFKDINYFLQYYLLTCDESTHTALLSTLLSSSCGIILLNHLLTEMDLFLTGAGRLVPSITQAMELAHTLIDSDTIHPDFSGMISQLKQIAAIETGVIDEEVIATFFNASFILCYFNTSFFKDEDLNQPLIKRQEEIISGLIAVNKQDKAERYYHVAKACGLSYNSARSFSFLSSFNHSDALVNKKYFQFILHHYELGDADSFFSYRYIAAQVVNTLLAQDFECNTHEVNNLLNRCYELLPIKKPQYKEVSLHYALHAVNQLAAIIAPRIGKTNKLAPFITLAREARPCFRIGRTKSNYCALDLEHFPTHYSLNTINAELKLTEQSFKSTIDKIQQVFLDSKTFSKFFNYLNTELESQLSHLPELPAFYQQNQIRLFDMSFPSGETFAWWSQLPNEQKTLKQAMHKLLLRLEQEAGYNLPHTENIDPVPRFFGFIPQEKANALLTQEKRIFKESSRSLPGIIHSPEAHRIQLAALRFFVADGTIKLPAGKNVHDLLTFIIDNNLWSDLFDSVGTFFGSPHFLMTYLRGTAQHQTLQKYAIFSFLKAMHQYIDTNCPFFDYQHLVLIQAATDNNFISLSTEKLVKNWLYANEHKIGFEEQNTDWSACYFKKAKAFSKNTPVFQQVLDYVNDNQPHHFIGRQAVLACLERNLEQAPLQIVYGMRGVGKTALVNQYIKQHNYAICWPINNIAKIDESIETLLNLITRYYPQLINDIHSLSQQYSSLEILHLALQRIPNWLLVFDNVSNEDDFLAYLPPQNINKKQHVLITSTNTVWKQYSNDTMYLGRFSEAETLDYLKLRLPDVNDEQLDALSKPFAQLPLGLKQACDTIKRWDISIETYLRFFAEQRAKLWEKEEEVLDYPQNMAQIWPKEVKTRIDCPYAQAIMYCLAFFISPYVDEKAFSLLGEDEVAHALKQLESYSLLEYSQESKHYYCHPLIQASLYEYLLATNNTDYIKLALALAPQLSNLDLIKQTHAALIEDYTNNPHFAENIMQQLEFNHHSTLRKNP